MSVDSIDNVIQDQGESADGEKMPSIVTNQQKSRETSVEENKPERRRKKKDEAYSKKVITKQAEIIKSSPALIA